MNNHFKVIKHIMKILGKTLKPTLKIVLVLTIIIHLLPLDTIFLWNRPKEYIGNTLFHHHKQLAKDGFIFVGKANSYGNNLYVYTRRGFLGREQYIVLTKSPDERVVKFAEKVSPSIYGDWMAFHCSRDLADDDPGSFRCCIYLFASKRVEIQKDEMFLLDWKYYEETF